MIRNTDTVCFYRLLFVLYLPRLALSCLFYSPVAICYSLVGVPGWPARCQFGAHFVILVVYTLFLVERRSYTCWHWRRISVALVVYYYNLRYILIMMRLIDNKVVLLADRPFASTHANCKVSNQQGNADASSYIIQRTRPIELLNNIDVRVTMIKIQVGRGKITRGYMVEGPKDSGNRKE